jgi:hypothetical protein
VLHITCLTFELTLRADRTCLHTRVDLCRFLARLQKSGHEQEAEVALIQATMAADPSDIGRRCETSCLASRPTAATRNPTESRRGGADDRAPREDPLATGGALSHRMRQIAKPANTLARGDRDEGQSNNSL